MNNKSALPSNTELESNPISLASAMIPVCVLIVLLFYNVFIFGDDALGGSNQFILLIGGFVAGCVGYFYKVSYRDMISKVASNVQSTTTAILILLMVGSLAGTWLISGIIPSMVYYGLQLLNPTYFLVVTVLICIVISIATGSSWTTSATVGIALIGIGNSLGINAGMTAGAVLSGAYFGDKMSPLSDTTNLAPVMAGGDLFTHIKYMTYTTVPTIVITLLVFLILGLGLESNGQTNVEDQLIAIKSAFNISPWLFIVPGIIIFLIVKKTPPLLALFFGTILGAIAAIIAQPQVLITIAGAEDLSFNSAYRAILNAITTETAIETSSIELNKLFVAKGMSGMLGTIWLIICAMVFGGFMEAIGALARISSALLGIVKSTFGLFASTVGSCLALNITSSDQYLAIVVPGKMFKQAYEDRNLAPENLSRTLEDSGTVTSALIPWNTCGAYQSSVLGVSVTDYFVYAIFNWLSPFTTLFFAALSIKIKQRIYK